MEGGVNLSFIVKGDVMKNNADSQEEVPVLPPRDIHAGLEPSRDSITTTSQHLRPI